MVSGRLLFDTSDRNLSNHFVEAKTLTQPIQTSSQLEDECSNKIKYRKNVFPFLPSPTLFGFPTSSAM